MSRYWHKARALVGRVGHEDVCRSGCVEISDLCNEYRFWAVRQAISSVPKSVRRNQRTATVATALAAWACREPDDKRSAVADGRLKASSTSLSRRSTRRPKAQLPPRRTALVDPLHSQNGGRFVLSWVVPTRRTYPILSLHYDGAPIMFLQLGAGRYVRKRA